MKGEIRAIECDRRRDQSEQDQEAHVYSIPFAGAMAGLNRNASYAAAKRGEIPTMSFGRLLKVPKAAWDRILQEGRPPPVDKQPPTRSRRT
jgi:hypothetical protein